MLCVVFGTSCSPNNRYEYENSLSTRIIFKDRAEGKDRFILQSDYYDFDGESIELFYKGEFDKDSVDAAVKRYRNDGIIPRRADLY
ncbi:MAG: hypothetical protein JJ975_06030 [Bacteroidia bacterium]|nr:hypothetical protein [Bacteroidia bacterium]